MDRETGPAREAPSTYAARLFGEEAAGNYGVMGRLMCINRLPVGDLVLLTVGFRITDRPGEKWTRRFNRFKRGEPSAAKAATRTFCAAFEDFLPAGNPRVVVVSSVSSGQNIVQNDTPASRLASTLAQSRAWEWLPHHITKDRHPSISGLSSAAERDATVDGVYLATSIGGEPGLVIVVDDFCTRGATLADIARAIRESNPGWKVQGASLAKAERAAYWKGKLTNAHIPDFLDATWRGDPEVAKPPKGIMVRTLPPSQPQVRYLVPTGSLQLPAGTYSGHETIEPHAQQRPRMIGRRSQWVTVYRHAQLSPILPVHGVDELSHETRCMIRRQQLVQRRRQQPHLLPTQISKWHVLASSPGSFHSLHPPTPSPIYETGCYRWFCFLTIDDPVFDHSTISYFIERIGREGFSGIFQGLNEELLRLGMLSPEMYADSSLVKANVHSYQLSRSGLSVAEFRERAIEENGLFVLSESSVDENGVEWEGTRYFQDSKGFLPLSPVDTDARWRTSRPSKSPELNYQDNAIVDGNGFILSRGVTHASEGEWKATPLWASCRFTTLSNPKLAPMHSARRRLTRGLCSWVESKQRAMSMFLQEFRCRALVRLKLQVALSSGPSQRSGTINPP